MFKKRNVIFTLSVMMLGMIMRATFTTLPTVLNEVAKSFDLQTSQLGILTTIPLLAFAVVSPLASWIAQRFGLEKTMLAVLALIFTGSLIRVINAPMLFLGTVLIGIGTAFVNVLLPAILVKLAPTKIGAYTSLYSVIMTLATAVFQIIAVPVAHTFNWQTLVYILSGAVAVAVITWSGNVKKEGDEPTVGTKRELPVKVNPWKNKYAWALLFTAGVQSGLFYTTIAWVPTIAQQSGLSGAQAGLVIGWLSLMGIPVSIIMPRKLAVANYKTRRLIVLGGSGLWIIANLMMLNTHAPLWYWLIIMTLVGVGGVTIFMYIIIAYATRTRNYVESAGLSGMAQSGGYLLAASAPLLYGLYYGHTHTWALPTIIMIIALILLAAVTWVAEREATVFE